MGTMAGSSPGHQNPSLGLECAEEMGDVAVEMTAVSCLKLQMPWLQHLISVLAPISVLVLVV